MRNGFLKANLSFNKFIEIFISQALSDFFAQLPVKIFALSCFKHEQWSKHMKIDFMIGVKNLLQQAPLCCLLYLTSLYD